MAPILPTVRPAGVFSTHSRELKLVMLKGFMWLMIFLIMGNLLQQALGLPIVGSVLGLLLLFMVLVVRRRTSNSMARVAGQLIHYFTLLILPSAAGLFFLGAVVTDHWLKLLVAVVLGTLISSVITLLTMNAMVRWQTRREGKDDTGSAAEPDRSAPDPKSGAASTEKRGVSGS